MTRPLQHFLLTLTFLTRIPLPKTLGSRIGSDTKLYEAIVFFPVIGLIIASVQGLVWLVAGSFLPAGLAAGLALVSGLLVTGALHEDGLADCADGLGATADREKALDIMRDSTIGTYGALALASTFLLRWAALSALEPLVGFLALLIAHGTSRSAMTLAMRFSAYARPKGLGKLAAGETSVNNFVVAIALPLVVALIIGSLGGITAAALGLLSGWCLLKYFEHRIGGYTGDCLGAIQQVAEVTILIALAGFWT